MMKVWVRPAISTPSARRPTGVDVPVPGQVFCAFHFPSGGVNTLTSDHADTVTSCPEYKVTAVRLVPGSAAAARRGE